VSGVVATLAQQDVVRELVHRLLVRDDSVNLEAPDLGGGAFAGLTLVSVAQSDGDRAVVGSWKVAVGTHGCLGLARQ
jgi:hypothetical protein